MPTTTTSPVVSLVWTLARLVANAPSQAALGYPVKIKAQSLIVTRANGNTETLAASATQREVTQALRSEHRDAITAAIAARVAEAIKAEPKSKDGVTPERVAAIVKAEREAFYASGEVTFPVTPRAARTATLDDTDDIMAALAAQAEA